MLACSKRLIQAIPLLLGVLVLGVTLVQAQDDQPQEDLLREDDRPGLRVVNGSLQLSRANVYVDGTLFFPNLPASCISPYLAVPMVTTQPQTRTLQVRSAEAEEEEVVATLEQQLEVGQDYTMLLSDSSDGVIEPWVIQDDNERELSPGQASLRLVRAASPNLPDIEICVAENCALLTNQEKVSNYIELGAGPYNLNLRLVGPDKLYNDIWPITVKAGEVHSVFVFDPRPGMVKPQIIAYVDTAQIPTRSGSYSKPQPLPYPCVGSDQPALPPGDPQPLPEGGYGPPPPYPPITGAFLSPTAVVVIVVLMLVAGGGWLAWQKFSRRGQPSQLSKGT